MNDDKLQRTFPMLKVDKYGILTVKKVPLHQLEDQEKRREEPLS